LRRLFKWLTVAILTLLAIIGALLLLVDTSAGHRLIVDRIEAMRPQSGLRIQIGRIDGSVWNRARIRDLRLSDPKGVFFESGDIALDWTPVAWVSNKLDITSVTADVATLARLPTFNPSTKKGAILPGFDIHVGQLAIKRLTIGAGVSGTARTGSLTGQADIRGGRALVKDDGRRYARAQSRCRTRPQQV
jgi:translocation and assembly module TamB